jgi:CRISPR-associated protein Cas1
MWRTVSVSQGEKIRVRDNWLNIWSEENEAKIPIDDLYSVVIDNRQAMVSVQALTQLSSAGVSVMFCDDKHRPVSLLQPLNTHYRPCQL